MNLSMKDRTPTSSENVPENSTNSSKKTEREGVLREMSPLDHVSWLDYGPHPPMALFQEIKGYFPAEGTDKMRTSMCDGHYMVMLILS